MKGGHHGAQLFTDTLVCILILNANEYNDNAVQTLANYNLQPAKISPVVNWVSYLYCTQSDIVGNNTTYLR